jgi:MoxR-like ATPase
MSADSAVPQLRAADGELEAWRTLALELEQVIGRVILGQLRAIRMITIAVFARGHVLLQGDVGVGKTTLLRAFAHVIGGAFARIEGTVDLMPSDLVYYTYVSREGRPAVDPGPLLQQGEELAIFFFNEINRARPQIHALLLRVMAERAVSAFNREYHLPHVVVFADRNRLEREETFEISSAARDRFMMEINLEAPVDEYVRRALITEPRFHSVETLIASLPHAILPHRELNTVAGIIQREVQASPTLQQYALDLWNATARPADYGVRLEGVDMHELVLAGASPRGMSMLVQAARVAAWLGGRGFITPEDIRSVFPEVIGHRVYFQPVYELRHGELSTSLMRGILEHVAAP